MNLRRACRFRGLLVAAALAVVSLPVLAQQVQILAPQNGATVRGVVEIRATKPDASDGWISFKIAPAGKQGQYVAAVIKPFVFKWDTRAKDKKGRPIYPDGDYVITATAYDPSGNQVGETSITVTVANSVPQSEIGGPVVLRCEYERAQQLNFKAEGKLTATLPEKEKKRTMIPLRLDVLVKAKWDEVVLSPTAGDKPAILDKTVGEAYVQVIGGEGANLPQAGKRFRMKVYPDGYIALYRKNKEHFPLGEYFVKLPKRPLTVGDSWKSDLALLPLPVAIARHVVAAQHKLEGFEYVGGEKCAKIVTTLSEKKKPLMVKVGHSIFPLKTSYQITRISYFGLEAKHFVAFEEIARHTIELPYQFVQMLYQLQLGGSTRTASAGQGAMGMGMGMGMMGAGPGMMMPGMGAGGMMPMAGEMMGAAGPMAGPAGAGAAGMMGMPAEPGMAMPGMMGSGMMGSAMMGGGMMGGMASQQQAQPVKVTVISSLKIMEQKPQKVAAKAEQ